MSFLNLPTFLVHCGVATDGEEEFIEAAPEGEPAGVTVAFAHQEATEAGEVAEEVSDCRQLSFAERGEHLQPDRRDDSGGGKVGVCGGDGFQLQQSHGQHAGEARDRFEAVGFHELPIFQAATGFDRLVEFFDEPPAFVVLDDLPRVVEASHGE